MVELVERASDVGGYQFGAYCYCAKGTKFYRRTSTSNVQSLPARAALIQHGGNVMNLRNLLRMLLAVVTATVGLVVVSQSAASAATHGPYLMSPFHSGLCLRPAGGSSSNVVVEQVGCNPDARNQWWYFVDTTNGYYRIKNAANGKCLNVQGASLANSAKVIQYPCGGSSTLNDQWRPVFLWTRNGVDWYNLVNRKSGRCMNIQGASQSSGADVIQFTCSSATNSAFTWQDGLIIVP